jgi:hypothetical protein
MPDFMVELMQMMASLLGKNSPLPQEPAPVPFVPNAPSVAGIASANPTIDEMIRFLEIVQKTQPPFQGVGGGVPVESSNGAIGFGPTIGTPSQGMFIPSRFPGARSTPITVETAPQTHGPKYAGIYRGKSKTIGLPQSTVKAESRRAGNTVPHEYGHAVYLQDLSNEEKNTWEKIHSSQLKEYLGLTPAAVRQKGKKSPAYLNTAKRFLEYYDDPAHSFAELFSIWAAKPEELIEGSPKTFGFFTKIGSNQDPRHFSKKFPDAISGEKK